MERGCIVEKTPVFVFYNYHSVPLPSVAVKELVSFVTSKLSAPTLRFICCCDVRSTPSDVLEIMESFDQCEIEHFSFPRLISFLSERIRRHVAMAGSSVGTVSLITDYGNFEDVMKDLTAGGWKITLFYPPDGASELLEHATEAFELPVNALPLELQQEASLEKSDGDVESLVGSAASQHSGWGQPTSPVSPPTSAPYVFHAPSYSQDVRAIAPPNGLKKNGFKKNGFAKNGFDSPSFTDEHNATYIASPTGLKRNGFDAPSFTQESKGKHNPFNKNPFEGPAVIINAVNAPVGNGNPRGNRNPFGSSPKPPGNRLKATQQVESVMGGGCATRPFGTQCPQWEDRRHSSNSRCQLYHPRKPCTFFPRCRLTAEVCFYAHPFCNGGECMCGEGARNPQLNHYSNGNQQ